MKELTNKQKCLKMWEWLAENPDKEKYDYIKKANDKDVGQYYECYACLHVERDHDPFNCRDKCPINWSSNLKDAPCTRQRSPYKRWSEAIMEKTKIKYALQMVQLIKTTWKE